MSEPRGRKRPVDGNIVNDRRHAMEDATPQGQSPIEEMGGAEKKGADIARKKTGRRPG